MNVVLIGYRGCGKTTVGRLLAERLWRPFVDLDPRIVELAGKSIKRIFEEDGEPRFRDLETQALREALQTPDVILALGGGSFGREENRRMVRDAGGRVIYLRCDPRELLRRIQADVGSPENRPSLTALGGGLSEIELKLAEREPIYREMAHAELDVTTMSPDDTVVHIARLL